MTSRRTLAVAAAAALAVGLAGCADAGEQAGSVGGGIPSVVASTSVYGQIAQEIGGDLITVTSIVDSASQDPHSFEPSAQDQLLISNADLIIENGGGYDAFVDALIEASGSDAPVLTAAEFSDAYPGNERHDDGASAIQDEEIHDHAEEDGDDHDHAHIEGFNEHVWYDPHTVEHLAEAIVGALSALLPADADTFERNFAALVAEVATLEASLENIGAAHSGEKVFPTEPVPAYLLAAAGLESVTPDGFSEAVEEGQDVPPAALLEALDLLEDGEVRAVIANTQTGGPETTRVVDDAEALGIPVITFTETLPEGETYISWMQANIEALAGALEE